MKLKRTVQALFFALMSTTPLATAAPDTAYVETASELNHIRFAEGTIVIEMAYGLSRLVREAREECRFNAGTDISPIGKSICNFVPTSWGIELAIGSIGTAKSDVADDALVNLLGLHLDAFGGELLDCHIFIRGHALLSRLERTQAKSLVEHCQSTFHDLQKRALKDIHDVKVEQICRTEAHVRNDLDEFIRVIKSNLDSDWEECYHQLSGQ
jgi:hypothetical protein